MRVGGASLAHATTTNSGVRSLSFVTGNGEIDRKSTTGISTVVWDVADELNKGGPFRSFKPFCQIKHNCQTVSLGTRLMYSHLHC